jgi:hypothetical protein
LTQAAPSTRRQGEERGNRGEPPGIVLRFPFCRLRTKNQELRTKNQELDLRQEPDADLLSHIHWLDADSAGNAFYWLRNGWMLTARASLSKAIYQRAPVPKSWWLAAGSYPSVRQFGRVSWVWAEYILPLRQSGLPIAESGSYEQRTTHNVQRTQDRRRLL